METPPTTCGPHSPQDIYNLLLKEGLSRVAAIQQLGSWQSESRLDQCQTHLDSDGEMASGLNSWHPNRDYDMPQDLASQVHWAIHIEMPRDCASCYHSLINTNDAYEARTAIQNSTRWGLAGGRWLYADQFNSTL